MPMAEMTPCSDQSGTFAVGRSSIVAAGTTFALQRHECEDRGETKQFARVAGTSLAGPLPNV